jgi:hypothetical protein
MPREAAVQRPPIAVHEPPALTMSKRGTNVGQFVKTSSSIQTIAFLGNYLPRK